MPCCRVSDRCGTTICIKKVYRLRTPHDRHNKLKLFVISPLNLRAVYLHFAEYSPFPIRAMLLRTKPASQFETIALSKQFSAAFGFEYL